MKNNNLSKSVTTTSFVTNINLPTTVDQNCYSDSLSVLNDTTFLGNVRMMSDAAINSLSIGGNFVVKDNVKFSGAIVTQGNIDLQNNIVTNVPSPKNLTDGVSVNELNNLYPQGFTGSTNHFLYWWWDANTNYSWMSQVTNQMGSSNIDSYISFNNDQITFNIPGIYKIGVTVGKSGYSGNGLGGFIQVTYTSSSGDSTIIGSAGLLNSGVINSQGSIQSSVIINKGEEGGYIQLGNNNSHGFKMDFLVFSITVFPFFNS